jgi:hypothetical protein
MSSNVHAEQNARVLSSVDFPRMIQAKPGRTQCDSGSVLREGGDNEMGSRRDSRGNSRFVIHDNMFTGDDGCSWCRHHECRIDQRSFYSTEVATELVGKEFMLRLR